MDQPTLSRARDGDRAAREALLRELQDPLYRMCLSLLRDAELAREATQETALRFLRRLAEFRGESSLTTWSMGIAINVVREMRRSRARLGDARDPPIARTTSMSAIADSPLDDATRSESTSVLHEVLGDLPDRQREAIVLRFFQELSVEETAVVMNCAQGTVKATVHQALRALRAKLPQFR